MRGLVLSGGGSKGAYQAAALSYILNEKNITYDIICGVSVGAINGAFISQFPLHQEKLAATQLINMWNKINTKSIYKRHFPFGRWHTLFKSSIYDSSPLHKLIRNNIDLQQIRNSDKIVNVGTISLSSGKYTIFDQTSDHFIDAVIASASFPGLLAPVPFLNQLWSDGGIKELSPIKKCIELGAEVIDIIITSPETRIKKFIERPNAIDVLKRSFDLSSDKIMANDIEKLEMYNKLASFNLIDKKYVKFNIIRPKHNLIENLLDFDPIKIQDMINKGYSDAKDQFLDI